MNYFQILRPLSTFCPISPSLPPSFGLILALARALALIPSPVPLHRVLRR